MTLEAIPAAAAKKRVTKRLSDRYSTKDGIQDLRVVVQRATKGDEDAAATLFDAYYPRVYRYALVKLRHKMDAEDVAAETFSKVLRDLKRFRWTAGGFEAWLFRIASNAVIDHMRRSAKERTEARSNRLEVHSDVSPEMVALQKESAKEMSELIQDLSQDQREVIALRFGAGLGSAEIARVMGRKPNAVRQLQFRALSSLREKADERAKGGES
jgi:RNA polymerase sigma-70 factor (ECF subfamily)